MYGTIKINLEKIAPMDEMKQNPQLKEVDNEIKIKQDHRYSWKTIRHSWLFWVGALLILVAIMYYIVSLNFAFAP